MTNSGLIDVEPRETAGRDTIARYQAQFRAAGFACLEILDGQSIDRVYCDYQDDFVTRKPDGSGHLFHFYQVKTKRKRNAQWSLGELFGINKTKAQNSDKIRSSCVGKLLVHTVNFKNVCGSVVFLTNVHFDNDVEEVLSDIESRKLTCAHTKILISNFNSALVTETEFSTDEVEKCISKLVLTPGVKHIELEGHNFEVLAKEAIYQYSEIELKHKQAKEIISDLMSLVEKKSFSKLVSDISEKELDEVAGIGIGDLLEILCISKGAYTLLLEGGDPKALRNASIIQRKLESAGANPEIIEFCSRWKIEWDVWIREKRHIFPEYELNFLLKELNEVLVMWTSGQIDFGGIKHEINRVWSDLVEIGHADSLNKELLVGGVFSALVRSESQ